ncbi:MAG: hypothetical protein K2N30_01180 [Clostridia bacterium]|nr:hypothetical protein [Clostridia bacterium]
MSDKEKKIYQYLIYGVSGLCALFSLIFAICYMCLGSALYGCFVLFFGFVGSVGVYVLFNLLLSIACDLKSKKNGSEEEEAKKEEAPKAE